MTGRRNRPRGTLFVLSAPSGTGKSTLVRRLVGETPGLAFSVSYTTRPMRDGERDGREYHFVDDARFDALVGDGALLEWAGVYDRRYGTGRAETEAVLAAGTDLVLDLDVQGAGQVRESGIPSVGIFVLPPDFTTLRERLTGRGTDSERQIARRLDLARREAAEFVHYDYLLVNDDLDRAARELRSIVEAERLRVARRAGDARAVIETFPAR